MKLSNKNDLLIKTVAEGRKKRSICQETKAPSESTDCCSLLPGIILKPQYLISYPCMHPHLQGCINHTTLATEPAYPAHHKQLSPHPLLR